MVRSWLLPLGFKRGRIWKDRRNGIIQCMQLSLSRQIPAMASFLPFGHTDQPEACSVACFRPRGLFMLVFKGLLCQTGSVSSRSALPLVLGTWPLCGLILELGNAEEGQILQRNCVCNRYWWESVSYTTLPNAIHGYQGMEAVGRSWVQGGFAAELKRRGVLVFRHILSLQTPTCMSLLFFLCSPTQRTIPYKPRQFRSVGERMEMKLFTWQQLKLLRPLWSVSPLKPP